MTDDAAWLALAIELAVRKVADGGGPVSRSRHSPASRCPRS